MCRRSVGGRRRSVAGQSPFADETFTKHGHKLVAETEVANHLLPSFESGVGYKLMWIHVVIISSHTFLDMVS